MIDKAPTFNVCPVLVRRAIEPECRKILMRLRETLSLPRVALAFISDQGHFEFNQALTTDSRQPFVSSRADEGLMGYSLTTDRLIIYPLDKESEDHFLNIEPKILFEVVAPVHFRNFPTGVLVVDYFEGEAPPVVDLEFRRQLQDFVFEIGQLFEQGSALLKDTTQQIREIVEGCRRKTRSKRGYVAIKMRDGRIEYITRDSDASVFIPLTHSEGITGRVFRTGQVINAADVWAHPDYIASDNAIHSEIVYPVKIEGDIVAVLNMESENESHYDHKRTGYVGEAAKSLTKLLSDFRNETLERARDDYDRRHALRYSHALLETFEGALDYGPSRHHNKPPSEFRIEDVDYLTELRTLTDELKKLNSLLRSRARRPRREKNEALKWGKHFDLFLSKFAERLGSTLGIGIGSLLVATAAALLQQLGVEYRYIESIWSHIKSFK